jgi:CubicO group peptidase (beta-lactamase class C family)
MSVVGRSVTALTCDIAVPEPSEFAALLHAALDGTRLPGGAVAVAPTGGAPVVVTAGTADASTGEGLPEDAVLAGCSAAKTVTAVAVLRLAAQGVLDLDADVRTWGIDLPRGPRAGDAPVTLRLLLAHRAGVRDPAGSFAPLGAGEPPTAAAILAGSTPAHPGPVTVTVPPGGAFDYSDAGSAVVEAVLERVTGLDVAEVVHTQVAEPLGLRALALWDGVDRSGTSPALAATLDRVRAAAVQSHGTDGAVLPDGRAHYPGRTGSCLWTSAGDLALLMADLGPALRGEPGSVLLTPAEGRAMADGGEQGVGLGLFLLGDDPADGVLTQGWGVGAQCQARAYPGGAVVAMVAGNPGASQTESGVGLLARRLAVAAGWAEPVPVG